MSAITYAQLMFGVAISPNPRREAKTVGGSIEAIAVMSFATEAAQAYADVRKATQERQAHALDKLIATYPAPLDRVVVTKNASDFARSPRNQGGKLDSRVTGSDRSARLPQPIRPTCHS
jgi:tRNA(fMet)-specific endonuclease VapC